MKVEVTNVSVSKKGTVWLQVKLLNVKLEVKEGENWADESKIGVKEKDVFNLTPVGEKE
jgi:hypothetical protein